MAMPVQSEVLINIDYDVRRKEEVILNLQRQLEKARGQVGAGHSFLSAPRGESTGEHDRLQAT